MIPQGRGTVTRRLTRQQRREMIRRGRSEANQWLSEDRAAEAYARAYDESIRNPRRNPDGTWGVR